MAKLWVGLVAVLVWVLFPRFGVSAAPSALYIREMNITGSEFIALTASSAVPDLSQYWLGYTGTDDGSIAVPSQQLPSAPLGAGQSIILSGGTVQVCDAIIVAKLSFALSNTRGTVALWQETAGSFAPLVAGVTWGSASGDSIKISTESRIVAATSAPANNVWYNDGSGVWVAGDLQNCSLSNVISQSLAPQPAVTWPAGPQPPLDISSVSTLSASGSIPAADIGLAPPQINELLPNPASPYSDTEDEFIELYNPNTAAFDLSGFKIEVGTSTKHAYSFPADTVIAAKAFAAFFSTDTNLSMSNSGGQVRLIDPLGNIISQSDVYTSAKDGQSWALALGKWQWTTSLTPNAANKISVAPTSAKSSGTSNKISSGIVKGASTNSSGSFAPPPAKPAPLHGWTLAGVGTIALLYGGYEYRNDLANNVYRLRRYFEARRNAGQ